MIQILLIAHLCFIVASSLLRKLKPKLLAAFILFVIYTITMIWAMHGQYEVISLLWILLAIRDIKNKEPTKALLWFSLALFFHFRALWFLPLLLPIASLYYSNREHLALFHSRPTTILPRIRANGYMLLLSLLLISLSVAIFVMQWRYLKMFPVKNVLYYKTITWQPALSYFVPTMFFAVCFIRQRSWMALILIAWLSLFFVRTPGMYQWYSISLMPVLAISMLRASPEEQSEQSVGLFAWFLFACRYPVNTTIFIDGLFDVFKIWKG